MMMMKRNDEENDEAVDDEHERRFTLQERFVIKYSIKTLHNR